MNVPFRLRKRGAPASATALLLWGDDTTELLSLLSSLRADPLPPVFPVAGGYLVKLAHSTDRAFAGVTRLRRLSDDLFLPVDADLLPTLFDDETAALVRARGLVFLPGGDVLGYDPARPLALRSLVTIPAVRRRTWHAPPLPPERANRLLELQLDRLDDTPDAVLIPDGPPIGTEDPRPADAGFLSRTSAKTIAGLGESLVGLGKLLHWKGLAKLGAGLVQSAVEWVPRLSESVIGRQEAALRELLRLFREGKLDDALRRALPLGADASRGGSVANNAILPTHNTNYSLGSLLNDGRPPSIWFGGGDVMPDLAKEYRKAAEAATARGDFRRAAFIYGKLLNDYQAAAAVLARGGLHHDAAVLYLDKLGDPLAAARQFEAAGEFDRALSLYRERGEHVAAGDLLRRVGEEEEAIREYLLAAVERAERQQYLAAADLLLQKKVEPREIARDYLYRGWMAWPHADALPCVLRLMPILAEYETSHELMRLAEAARARFEPASADSDAGRFFTALARLADRPHLVKVRDDLRDLALRGLADRLRRRSDLEVRPGDLVSMLLGQTGAWTPDVVNDADVAFRGAVQAAKEKPEVRRRRDSSRIRLGTGTVTAACGTPTQGVVFVGFELGAVVCFDPHQGTVVPVLTQPAADVARLAATPAGDMVVALLGYANLGTELVTVWRRPEGWFRGHISRLPPVATYLLTSVALDRSEPVVGIWNGNDGRLLRGATMVSVGVVLLPPSSGHTETELLSPGSTVIDTTASPPVDAAGFSLGLLDDRDFWWQAAAGAWRKVPLGWAVQQDALLPPRHGSLLLRDGHDLTVAVFRLGVGGRLYTARLRLVREEWERLDSSATGEAGYTAAAILGAKRFAGVRADRIDWLQVDPKQPHSLKVRDSTRMAMEGAVACFPSPATAELLVVLRDGWLVRVPLPH
jgi:tetratricopeptide (TPR) repeat protein